MISRAAVNASGWGLCVCVPLTTRDRGSPLHVAVAPPDGGVRLASYALVDQVRAIDRSRLVERWGIVGVETHQRIVSLLRVVAPG
ncbi:hypothetical protein BH20ACT16_BH20ACT16_13810 [soil metagenome]